MGARVAGGCAPVGVGRVPLIKHAQVVVVRVGRELEVSEAAGWEGVRAGGAVGARG